MLEWLAYYWPTILVCLALGGIVFAIIISMVRSLHQIIQNLFGHRCISEFPDASSCQYVVHDLIH